MFASVAVEKAPAALAARPNLGVTATAGVAASPGVPVLTIVVPTFNERGNVAELVRRLDCVMGATAWELVFVDDDSPDGTADLAKSISRTDPRVRCIRRVGRRGLAGACIEGMLASSSPFVAVMDGDLQHDEAILPLMLLALQRGDADLVVGSRHVAGGSATEGFSPFRAAISTAATRLTRLVFDTNVKDLMSGFFMLRRDIVEDSARELSTSGFKILADILASRGRSLKTAEIPYTFRKREVGESKLSFKVVLDFAGLLINKITRGVLPVSFVMFALVGLAGVVVHMGVLRTAMGFGVTFASAQIMATIIAMTSNFFVNNLVTYRSASLKNWALLRGFILFSSVCGLGAVANIGTATLLFNLHAAWWLAALAGIVMGAVWNYTLSSVLVWRQPA